MSVRDPQRDLPAGLRGGADAWDNGPAGVILRTEFFRPSGVAPAFTLQQGDLTAHETGTASLTWQATGLPAPTIKVQRLAPPPRRSEVEGPTQWPTNAGNLTTVLPARNVGAGSLLMIVVYWESSTGTVSSITDSAGGVWAFQQDLHVTATTGGAALAYSWGHPGGASVVVSITFSSPPVTEYDVALHEFTGGDVSDPFEAWLTSRDWTASFTSSISAESDTFLLHSAWDGTLPPVLPAVDLFTNTFYRLSAQLNETSVPRTHAHEVAMSASGNSVTNIFLALKRPPSPGWTDVVEGTDFSGLSPLTYTTPLLTISGYDQAQYRAVATNSSGTAESAPLLLTVLPPVAPFFTLHPTDQTVLVGATATFTAATSGSPLPSYRWQVLRTPT